MLSGLMPASQRDLYDVLGVERHASAEDLKRAYRRLAMEYHPDRNSGADAAERFKEVNRAYEVLSDAEKRAAYDRFGHAGVEGTGGPSGFDGFAFEGFGDIFDAFFGGRRAAGPVRGGDLRLDLRLDFTDAVFGAEKEIKVSRLEHCAVCAGSGSEPGAQRAQCRVCEGSGEVRRVQRNVFGRFVNVAPCEACEGEGTVIEHPCQACGGIGREQRNRKLKIKVPAGVDDGAQMRLSGEGDAGTRGGPAGNLYVDLRVREHERFLRDGDDLVLPLSVNVAQAALGAQLEIPVIDGSDEELAVPAGTQHGDEIRFRGRGVAHLRGHGRGDLRIRVNVDVPKQLTEEQREIFERLAEAFATPAGENGVFSKVRGAFSR